MRRPGQEKERDILQNLVFSLNATMPVFLVMVVGYVLGHRGYLPKSFCSAADQLVYHVALPVMLFCDMATLDLAHDFNVRFVLYCAGATTSAIVVLWLLARRFLPDRNLVGEFVQASYRSSAAILGVAFIQNIYGNSGMAPLMILGSVPLFNIFAVVILTVESPAENQHVRPEALLRRVLSNPILIGIVLGTLYSLLPFGLPTIAQKTFNIISNLATPLSLLSIGATFEGRRAIKKLGPTLLAAACKLLILPGIFLPLAVTLGFRDQELVALLIMLGSPTTPSAYVMARNMGHEGVLTASAAAVTTLLSALTVTMWIFLLRSGGYIA